jgi:hypothetical protein
MGKINAKKININKVHGQGERAGREIVLGGGGGWDFRTKIWTPDLVKNRCKL